MAASVDAGFDVEIITEDRWERYRAIRLAALAADPGAFATTWAEASMRSDEDWRRLATPSQRHTVFAAVDRPGGAWIGLVGGMRAEGVDGVELVSMWTAPAARRLGVGRALIDTVVAWADGSPVALWVVRTNTAARALYEAHGFRLDEAYVPAADEPCRNEVRMVRPG